jgi:hypothetical protein
VTSSVNDVKEYKIRLVFITAVASKEVVYVAFGVEAAGAQPSSFAAWRLRCVCDSGDE